MRLRGRHYRTGDQVELTCADGRITSVGVPTLEPVDAEAGWIAPAFMDLNVTGTAGLPVESITQPEELTRVIDECATHGVSSCLLRLAGGPRLEQIQILSRWAAWRRNEPRFSLRIPGVHVICSGLTASGFDQLQEAAEGSIKLVTLDLDHDQAIDLISYLRQVGVVAAFGETKANGDRIRQAIDAGARLAISHGASNPNGGIREELGDDRLWLGVFAGRPADAALLDSSIRAKGVSRSLVMGDMRNGFSLDRCSFDFAALTGFDLADAIDMASIRPRELLDLPVSLIEVGAPSELMLFDVDENQMLVRKICVG